MKEIWVKALTQLDKSTSGATNPFERFGVGTFGWPSWVGWTFGSLFVVIGICIFFLFHRKAQEKKERYKKAQLVEYNKKYKKNEINYKRTGMYLPAWEVAKASAPIMLTAVFVFVGIAWIVGNTLTTL